MQDKEGNTDLHQLVAVQEYREGDASRFDAMAENEAISQRRRAIYAQNHQQLLEAIKDVEVGCIVIIIIYCAPLPKRNR